MVKERESRIYKKYVISITLVIALCLSGIFLGMVLRTRHLIYEALTTQARAHFQSIVITRKWNAHYGGVYVEKTEGVESNPYLDNPDNQTTDGKIYTKKNPALMTREISEYAEKEGLFKFHITSLKPVNPNNAPDEFEKVALHQFEEGKREVIDLGSNQIRYMAPLHVEKGCLPCHARHGYKLGDIRGGISVTFNIGDIQEKLRSNLLIIFFSALTTISLLLSLIFFFTVRFWKRLSEARRIIERMAITDELTGISNRRHIITRFQEEFMRAKRQSKSFGCMILDIDHFKLVNDNYGHLVGDKVLIKFSAIIKDSVRMYDLVGRFGGEEFLVLLPETDFDDTKKLAERLQKNIGELLSVESDLPEGLTVSVSIGIACINDQDKTIDDLLKRADDGLYIAKTAGRDRVGWI
jgi:diguanylate cyclase (GGDEF)-like protein